MTKTSGERAIDALNGINAKLAKVDYSLDKVESSIKRLFFTYLILGVLIIAALLGVYVTA